MTKRVYTAIGLMSGTSLDGVDAAIIRTDGEQFVETGAWTTHPYPELLRDGLRTVLGQKERTSALADVEHRLTVHHIDTVSKLLEENRVTNSKIDIIGFHGHTVTHLPKQRFTWQIGDAEMLAEACGIDVVTDFRLADVAAGGQGAPFAPLYHRALLDSAEPVAILNLGGVANVTWIEGDRLIAFDTGPGNALIDDWVARHNRGRFDESGDFARIGTVDRRIVEATLAKPYFGASPPKSLDRQDFDLSGVDALSFEDGAATLTAITVGGVQAARAHFPASVTRWLVTGGGRLNAYMMACLVEGLGVAVAPVEEAGWQGDALEAQAFGYLAVRSLRGLPLSLPSTTGVPKALTGGRRIRSVAT